MIYDFKVTTITGQEQSLSNYRGKVLLIVNVASACAFTPQYEGLQKLYEQYKEEGFEILAFPCNQFREQESGSHQAIQEFCKLNYGVTFPLFAKIEVNGIHTHPLYAYLKEEAKGLFGSRAVKWNFTKFLIDSEGRVLSRYAPASSPDSIEKDIQALIKKS